jgi:hypothetical protein
MSNGDNDADNEHRLRNDDWLAVVSSTTSRATTPTAKTARTFNHLAAVIAINGTSERQRSL